MSAASPQIPILRGSMICPGEPAEVVLAVQTAVSDGRPGTYLHRRGGNAAPGPKLKGNRLMSLINLVVTLVVVGVGLWLINTYVPMDRKIKKILNVVVVIVVLLWLLRGFGILGDIGAIRVGD